VFSIGDQELARLKALGVGVTLQNHAYLNGKGPDAGPPYRKILESGVKAGGSTDARNVAPMNPWASIYYMVTGKNSAGDIINEGQTISREEALRIYTRDSAWFTKEESMLGSIETGKLADIVVLSDDYFKVAEDQIRKLQSVLTIVGGDIVYNQID
jgi:predicted amidohydrolase YtcJ